MYEWAQVEVVWTQGWMPFVQWEALSRVWWARSTSASLPHVSVRLMVCRYRDCGMLWEVCQLWDLELHVNK